MTDPVYHDFRMTEAQARNVHRVVASHMGALKNWIATGVETKNTGVLEPTKLVKELREYEALYAAFNVEAKLQVADALGTPIETRHFVRNHSHD